MVLRRLHSSSDRALLLLTEGGYVVLGPLLAGAGTGTSLGLLGSFEVGSASWKRWGVGRACVGGLGQARSLLPGL